jgi:hypothetical protein
VAHVAAAFTIKEVVAEVFLLGEADERELPVIVTCKRLVPLRARFTTSNPFPLQTATEDDRVD